jgi:hypothetical protein
MWEVPTDETMAYRTVKLSNYDAYLEYEFPPGSAGSAEARVVDIEYRTALMTLFPFAVMLEVAYPEMDFANRWCWFQFGPAQGECQQMHSEYRACDQSGPHCHLGRWTTHWHGKTDYNFGFHEWYFATEADRVRFLEFVPHLDWGEHYPE